MSNLRRKFDPFCATALPAEAGFSSRCRAPRRAKPPIFARPSGTPATACKNTTDPTPASRQFRLDSRFRLTMLNYGPAVRASVTAYRSH